MGVFQITAENLEWIDGQKDNPGDLCLHGDAAVKIGDEIFTYSATVSATTLYLLKTLTQNHMINEENQMLPCCGHFMIPNEDLTNVDICGCPNGIDWSVLHDKDSVKLITESGKETIIALDEYRREVFQFADKIEDFYKKCSPKDLSNDYDRSCYQAFWNEWHRRRGKKDEDIMSQAKTKLPEKISRLIETQNYKTDDIGMSSASVQIYHDKVLKIQDYNKESENEYWIMQYLYDKLPVPKVYAHEVSEGKSYLLMSKCSGQMACSDEYLSQPRLLCKLLAAGLKQLWSVNISENIPSQNLTCKLAAAKYNIEHGLVDIDNTEPDTFGENGFKNPSELLQWLYEHRPLEELALSHGDYCLPNIFGIGEEISGYIDLGKTGVADKWCDIAICYRSLHHNFSGKYSGKAHANYNDTLLFEELGIEPNWEKIRYYILLDELF